MPRLLTMTTFAALLVLNSAFARSAPTCNDIDKAISANEDFVEVALGIDQLPIAPAVQTIKTTLRSVETGLSLVRKAESSIQFGLVEQNTSKNDLPRAAVAAIEIYKLLINNYESRLPTPLDTAMLDYAGFKLLALTSAKNLDWPEIIKTIEVGRTSLEKTKHHIKDQAIIDLADSISTALTASLAAQDQAWLSSSAQILLDSVDLIERLVKNSNKQACD